MGRKIIKNIMSFLTLSLLISLVGCFDLFNRSKDDIDFTKLEPLSDVIPYDYLGSGKIVFERCSEQGGDIYIIDLENQTSWGFGDEVIDAPAVSPDGKMIAFTTCTPYDSDNWTVWDVFVMDIHGNGCQNISHHDGQDGSPSWTFDSQQVIFYVHYGNCFSIFRQSPVEYPSDRILIFGWCLTSQPDPSHISPGSPVSASSRNELVFSTEPGTCIYKMNMNGENLVLLTKLSKEEVDKQCQYCSPVWSPDGEKIAFIKAIRNSQLDLIRYDIITMNRKGDNTEIIRTCDVISNGFWWGSNDISICWSPDGSKLLFSKPHGDLVAHLYVINSDGSNLTQVTTVEGVFDRSVTWSY